MCHLSTATGFSSYQHGMKIIFEMLFNKLSIIANMYLFMVTSSMWVVVKKKCHSWYIKCLWKTQPNFEYVSQLLKIIGTHHSQMFALSLRTRNHQTSSEQPHATLAWGDKDVAQSKLKASTANVLCDWISISGRF